MANRFKDYDDEVRDAVLDFENTVLQGRNQFFDTEELEIIIDYYLETSDLDRLEAAVRYAEGLYPSSNSIRLRRAHLYSARNQFDRALDILLQLERVEPDNTDVAYALGAVYSMLDHPDQAIRYYRKASADGYELGTVNGNIADEYYKLGRLNEAIMYYKKALAADPANENAMLNLLDTYAEAGQADKSADYFKRMVEREPYSKLAWYCLGCSYYDLGLAEKAIDALEYAIAIDKTYFDAYMCMADCYEDTNNHASAVECLRRSLDYAEHKETVYCSIGIIYMRAGNYDTAMLYLKQAEQAATANPEAASYFLADLYSAQADCYRALNEYYLAAQSAAAALSLTADPGRILRFLGSLHEEHGDSEQAAKMYLSAIEREPDTDDNWTAYIDFLLRAGRYDEAIDYTLQAAASATDQLPFDLRFAVEYFKTGRRNYLFNAINACLADDPEAGRQLLEICPEMADDPEVLNLLHPQKPTV
ncbi:MAG: tetratricopeptide repeat protein [Bacteroidales bacterium]|nr:tetratricopeptide repeat protein [Bacteroidales bacterium]